MISGVSLNENDSTILLPAPVGSQVSYIFIPATGLECDQTDCEDAVFWIRSPYTAIHILHHTTVPFGQIPKKEVETFSVLSGGNWSQMHWQGWPKGKAAVVTERIPVEDLWEIFPGNNTKAEAIRL